MPLCFFTEDTVPSLTFFITWLTPIHPSKLHSKITVSRTPFLMPNMTYLAWIYSVLFNNLCHKVLSICLPLLSHSWLYLQEDGDLVLPLSASRFPGPVYSRCFICFLSLIHLLTNWAISWLISFSCSETFYPHSRLSSAFWNDEIAGQMRNFQVSVGHYVKSPSVLLWSIYTWQPDSAEGHLAWWLQWMPLFFTGLVISSIANFILWTFQFPLSSSSVLLSRLTFSSLMHSGPSTSTGFLERWGSASSSMIN